jgi:tetratricopeptide (TPR) repeat protein
VPCDTTNAVWNLRGYLQFARISMFQGLGDVYVNRKDYPRALDYFNQALELSRQQHRSSHVANTARRMGDLYRATGNKSQALIYYREAIDQIESIRSLLTSGPNRQSYFGGWLASYRGLIEMLWSEGAYAQAFHYGERVRARTFLDNLRVPVPPLKPKHRRAPRSRLPIPTSGRRLCWWGMGSEDRSRLF